MSSTLVPFNDVLFRNKNILSYYFSSDNFHNFFGLWSNSNSSIIDFKKNKEMWEKIKKYNLQYINNKTREWIENSKYNKLREIFNKVLKNTENQTNIQELTQKNLSHLMICPYQFKVNCNKKIHCEGCLCKKVDAKESESESESESDSESDSETNIEIQDCLLKPKPNYRSKLVSNFLENNEMCDNNGNDNYKLFGILFCGLGLGLGTYYFYRKNK
jgi:hypothetical protein